MKVCQCLLICLFLLSCQSNTETVTEETTQTKEPEIKQWLSYKGESGKPNVVLVSGDEEYRSEEALPQLAKILNKHHGFNCTVLFAQDPAKPGIINPNYLHNIPGLERLKTADMMVIFTRFRALPDDQMQHIDDFLKTGKPVVGIRTSTHAFRFKDVKDDSKFMNYCNFYDGDDEWKDGFGRLVLGEHWISHHGHHKHQSSRGVAAPDAGAHPILAGIGEGEIWGPTDVYGVRLPLPGDSKPVVLGQVVDRDAAFDEADALFGMRASDSKVATKNEANKRVENPNEPMMPIAWTKSYQIPGGKQGKAFATTIGSSTDMLSEGVRRMLVNSVFWGLDMTAPAKANVTLVGNYQPSAYSFTDKDHWTKVNRTVASVE